MSLHNSGACASWYIIYAHDWIETKYVPGRSYVLVNFLSSLPKGVKQFFVSFFCVFFFSRNPVAAVKKGFFGAFSHSFLRVGGKDVLNFTGHKFRKLFCRRIWGIMCGANELFKALKLPLRAPFGISPFFAWPLEPSTETQKWRGEVVGD